MVCVVCVVWDGSKLVNGLVCANHANGSSGKWTKVRTSDDVKEALDQDTVIGEGRGF